MTLCDQLKRDPMARAWYLFTVAGVPLWLAQFAIDGTATLSLSYEPHTPLARALGVLRAMIGVVWAILGLLIVARYALDWIFAEADRDA